LDLGSEGLDFDELLRLNEALVGRDVMPAYDGLAPAGAGAPRNAQVSAPPQLPKISFERRAAVEGARLTRPAPSATDGRHTWLNFKLDRDRIMAALAS
jgi:hypothetical protein